MTFTCERNGIDGFISAVDWIVDRAYAEQPEISSDSMNQDELSAAQSQGWRQ